MKFNTVISTVTAICALSVLILILIEVYTNGYHGIRNNRNVYLGILAFQILSIVFRLFFPALHNFVVTFFHLLSFFLLSRYVLSDSTFLKTEILILSFILIFLIFLYIYCASFHVLGIYDFCYVMFICLVDIFDCHSYILNLQRNLKNNRASYLKMQMNPHFVFNVLMSISDLAYSDPIKTSDAIKDFADYLKGNLKEMDHEDLVDFKSELENIEIFVNLEKLVHEDRFEMIYELNVMDFKVPALSVQPLVENGIKHSLGKNKQMILLRTMEKEGFIEICVENLFDDYKENKDNHLGIALKNVKENIELLCHGFFSLTIHDHKCIALIRIPKEDKG